MIFIRCERLLQVRLAIYPLKLPEDLRGFISVYTRPAMANRAVLWPISPGSTTAPFDLPTCDSELDQRSTLQRPGRRLQAREPDRMEEHGSAKIALDGQV